MPWRVVPPDSDRISRVPSYSGYSPDHCNFRYETFTLFGVTSQTLLLPQFHLMQVLQPQQVNLLVWALARSLAATSAISIDYSSCRYLDVSVPCVHSYVTTLLITPSYMFPYKGFPHSEISGSKPICRLSEAYR